jgi:predicted esterase
MKSDLEIHRHVFVHKKSSQRVLVLLHGTGGDENDLLPLAELLAPKSSVLAIAGNVLENGMRRFFRRHSIGVFDEEDLQFRCLEFSKFLVSAQLEYGFVPAHTCVVGFSNGANMAAAALLLHPGFFSEAVLFRPVLPVSPALVPDLTGIRVWIGGGIYDSYGGEVQTLRLQKTLDTAGARTQTSLILAGHEITQTDVARAKHWLRSQG